MELVVRVQVAEAEAATQAQCAIAADVHVQEVAQVHGAGDPTLAGHARNLQARGILHVELRTVIYQVDTEGDLQLDRLNESLQAAGQCTIHVVVEIGEAKRATDAAQEEGRLTSESEHGAEAQEIALVIRSEATLPDCKLTPEKATRIARGIAARWERDKRSGKHAGNIEAAT